MKFFILSTTANFPVFLGTFLAFLFLLLVIFLLLKQFLRIFPPNKMVIISGSSSSAGGGKIGYRVQQGGRVFCKPVIERIHELDLTVMPLVLEVKNVYTKGGISVTSESVAFVKVSSEPALVAQAIERFLEQDRAAIERVARETLEGVLREVLATLTPEELCSKQAVVLHELIESGNSALELLGLEVEVWKFLGIRDNRGYLASLTREKINDLREEVQQLESSSSAG